MKPYRQQVIEQFPCPDGFSEIDSLIPGDVVYDRCLINKKVIISSWSKGLIVYTMGDNATCSINDVWYLKRKQPCTHTVKK